LIDERVVRVRISEMKAERDRLKKEYEGVSKLDKGWREFFFKSDDEWRDYLAEVRGEIADLEHQLRGTVD
jgi:hypothetical protein